MGIFIVLPTKLTMRNRRKVNQPSPNWLKVRPIQPKIIKGAKIIIRTKNATIIIPIAGRVRARYAMSITLSELWSKNI
jgi:hypothetical protein